MPRLEDGQRLNPAARWSSPKSEEAQKHIRSPQLRRYKSAHWRLRGTNPTNIIQSRLKCHPIRPPLKTAILCRLWLLWIYGPQLLFEPLTSKPSTNKPPSYKFHNNSLKDQDHSILRSSSTKFITTQARTGFKPAWEACNWLKTKTSKLDALHKPGQGPHHEYRW